MTLLIFGTAVSVGILAAAPSLLRDHQTGQTTTSGDAKAKRRSAKRLSIYLNDHLADETLRLELARRAIPENEGTPLWAFLELLSWELEEDRDSLVGVMGQLGVRRSRNRLALARITEKVSRLKPEGQITGHSPLRPLVELESLQQGIDDKIAMWNALRSSVESRVHGVDFDALIARAERQADEVERRRLAVAPDALAYPAPLAAGS